MTQERPIALGIGMSSSYIEQGSEKEGQAADADRDGVDSDPGTTGTVHSAHYSGMNKKQPCWSLAIQLASALDFNVSSAVDVHAYDWSKSRAYV